MPFTLRNLKEDLEDVGSNFDGPPDLEFRLATGALELEQSGLGYQSIPPEKRSGAGAAGAGQPTSPADPPRLPLLRDTARAMSQENVEVVRRFIEALELTQTSGDWQPVLAEVDPDVQIDDLDISLDTELYRGRDRVSKWVGVWSDAWESWRVEDVQVRPVGDDRAIALFLMVVRGKGSGIELSRRDALVCTLRAGKIAEVGYYNDQHQALEAVGLSEQDAHADL